MCVQCTCSIAQYNIDTTPTYVRTCTGVVQLCYFLCLFAEPNPPRDVTFTITGTDSAVVSWTASQSKCGAIANYSVTYQLTSGMSCSATVYTTGTSVTLRGLIPNVEYSVVVSATNSRGDTSELSGETPFTVSTTSAGMYDPSHSYMHYITHALYMCCAVSFPFDHE